MAKANKGDILFHRGKATDQEDMWDDSALIEAYEKAASLAYDAVRDTLQSNGEFSAEDLSKHSPNINKSRTRDESITGTSSCPGAEEIGNKRKAKKKRSSDRKKWQIGDKCLARYSEDGQWYEATIIALDREHNQCKVQYDGYENEEDLNLGILQKIPETSMDDEVSGSSGREEEETGNEYEDVGQMQQFHMRNVGTVPLMPPPVPPHLLRHTAGVPNEDEAMAAMLMSWYTSGYHTGYYQAMHDMKRQKK